MVQMQNPLSYALDIVILPMIKIGLASPVNQPHIKKIS